MMNPLLRVAAISSLLVAPAIAAGHWLKTEDLIYVFAGREVTGHYANGAAFSEIYHRDGRITYKDDQSSFNGTWAIKGSEFCTTYDKGPGGCYRVQMHSSNCFAYYLVENGISQPAWIARSSQTKYPTTCPAPTGN
jgi:hypothetical protein